VGGGRDGVRARAARASSSARAGTPGACAAALRPRPLASRARVACRAAPAAWALAPGGGCLAGRAAQRTPAGTARGGMWPAMWGVRSLTLPG